MAIGEKLIAASVRSWRGCIFCTIALKRSEERESRRPPRPRLLFVSLVGFQGRALGPTDLQGANDYREKDIELNSDELRWLVVVRLVEEFVQLLVCTAR